MTGISEPSARLDELLLRACDEHSQRTALCAAAERYTYADLALAIQRVQSELELHSVRADEPILVVVHNRPLDIAAWAAVWRCRGVVVPIHAEIPAAVLQELLARTHARYLVRGSQAYSWPESVQTRSDTSDSDSGCVVRLQSAVPPERALLRDAALVVFTSGSTGRPKGVVLGHAEFTGKLAAIQQVIPFSRDERTLLLLQLTFSFGQWVSLLSLATGGELHMRGRFEPLGSLDALAELDIARVAVVPSMVRAWFANPRAEPKLRAIGERASLHTLVSGGEILSASLGRALRGLLPHTGIADVFGLTETNTSDFILPPGAYDASAGGIGWPTQGVEYRIIDEQGHEPPTGAAAELQIRSRFRMRGYFDDPQTTEQAFNGEWLRTGDLGFVRTDGSVELVGRQKDLIVRGANKIVPLEVENALAAHPAVLEALAVGVPDGVLGERLHVLIVRRDGSQITAPELRSFARTRLEKFKVPDDFQFVDRLPTGSTGKTSRMGARELVAARRQSHT